MALRYPMFHCATHGRFSAIVKVDLSECDGRFASVTSAPCPKCGEAAPFVIQAPKVQTTVAAVEFGGRLYKRDDVEQHLEESDQKPVNSWDSPEFDERFTRTLARNVKKELNGELPHEEVSPEVAAALAPTSQADVEVAKAQQETVTNLIRTTEFPE